MYIHTYMSMYAICLQAPLTLSLPDIGDGDDPSSIANLSFERNMLPKTLGGIKQRPYGKEGHLVVFTAKVRTQAVLDFVSSVSDKVCEGVGECVCMVGREDFDTPLVRMLRVQCHRYTYSM